MESNNSGQIIKPDTASDQPIAQAPPAPPSAAPQPIDHISQPPAAPPPPEPSVPQAPSPVITAAPEPAQQVPMQPIPAAEPPAQQSPIFEAEIPPNEYAPPTTESTSATEDSVSWNASEYIAHHKSSAWFVALAALAIAVAIVVYFITGRDLVSVIVIMLVAAIFGYYAAQQPKVQQYTIDLAGVSIGQKGYSFHDFKSFSIIDEGPFASITFMPLKRFMPAVSIFYDPQDEDKIVSILTRSLPMEMRRNDVIDRAMRRIRF